MKTIISALRGLEARVLWFCIGGIAGGVAGGTLGLLVSDKANEYEKPYRPRR